MKELKQLTKNAWSITAVLFAFAIFANVFAQNFASFANSLLIAVVWLFFLIKAIDARVSPKQAQSLLIVGLLLAVVGTGAFGITVFPDIQFFGFDPILNGIIQAIGSLALATGAGIITYAVIGLARHQL